MSRLRSWSARRGLLAAIFIDFLRRAQRQRVRRRFVVPDRPLLVEEGRRWAESAKRIPPAVPRTIMVDRSEKRALVIELGGMPLQHFPSPSNSSQIFHHYAAISRRAVVGRLNNNCVGKPAPPGPRSAPRHGAVLGLDDDVEEIGALDRVCRGRGAGGEPRRCCRHACPPPPKAGGRPAHRAAHAARRRTVGPRAPSRASGSERAAARPCCRR